MRWILVSLALLLVVLLCACDMNCQPSGDVDKAYRNGYDAGYDLGYYSGFGEGCHVGYDMGRYEEKLGLTPSMDWFFDRYPQYR